MTSRTPLRSCEDVDETALSFAEIKALCAGDPRIRERMELDVDVAKLKIMKADYQSKKFRLEDSVLKRFPAEIQRTETFITGIQADMQTLAAHPHPEGGFAKHECVILFLRQCSDLTRPFYTIEIRGRKVIQVRGMKNCRATPEVQAFVNQFEKQILHANAAA